jgi:hypothetical protein
MDLLHELVGMGVELFVGDLGGYKVRRGGLALGSARVLSVRHQAGSLGSADGKASRAVHGPDGGHNAAWLEVEGIGLAGAENGSGGGAGCLAEQAGS